MLSDTTVTMLCNCGRSTDSIVLGNLSSISHDLHSTYIKMLVACKVFGVLRPTGGRNDRQDGPRTTPRTQSHQSTDLNILSMDLCVALKIQISHAPFDFRVQFGDVQVLDRSHVQDRFTRRHNDVWRTRCSDAKTVTGLQDNKTKVQTHCRELFLVLAVQ